ncbi:hypothetical protein DUNSADRAFT_736 [Dunaliella salina]|uniref:Uncharacterized protein n=1 Tax=Dunaliella salina TaxID=3046 RepID=A0ABQ7GXX1_DUNSA|nr:hypothetical protein DUNSADRAFT_736 [Dunaliella salina]|eukprot:KAF5839451.1 hypothetical protein DUNSADRAFT_736 [Dunaliella salina]
MQLSKAVAFVGGQGLDVNLPPLHECFYPTDHKQAWARPGGRYDEAMQAMCKELLPAMEHLVPPEEEAPPSRRTQNALKKLETRWSQNFRVHMSTAYTACLVEGHLRVVHLGDAQAAKDAEYSLLDRERLVKLLWTSSWEGLTLGVSQATLGYVWYDRGLLWPNFPPNQRPPAKPTADATSLTPLFLHLSRWTPAAALKYGARLDQGRRMRVRWRVWWWGGWPCCSTLSFGMPSWTTHGRMLGRRSWRPWHATFARPQTP